MNLQGLQTRASALWVTGLWVRLKLLPLGRSRRWNSLFAAAVEWADGIDPRSKADVLTRLAEGYAKIGHWRQARETADDVGNHVDEVKALSRILIVWAARKNPALVDGKPEWR